MSSPGDWYASLPPISKLFGTSCVMTTVLVTLGLLNPRLLVLNYELVLFKFQVGAVP
jgi:Derlin-2/3